MNKSELIKEIKKYKVQQVNKEIAIESLKSMLEWSDRIGSDERDHIDYIIDILTRKN